MELRSFGRVTVKMGRMRKKTSRILLSIVVAIGMVAMAQTFIFVLQVWAQETASGTLARRIGSVKAINGNTLTLTPDSGSDITVTMQPNARILRIAPGEKDLKNATPVQLQDLQIGDRIRVRGQASGDAASIPA